MRALLLAAAIALAIPIGVIVAYYVLLMLGVPAYRTQTEMIPFLKEHKTYGSAISIIRYDEPHNATRLSSASQCIGRSVMPRVRFGNDLRKSAGVLDFSRDRYILDP